MKIRLEVALKWTPFFGPRGGIPERPSGKVSGLGEDRRTLETPSWGTELQHDREVEHVERYGSAGVWGGFFGRAVGLGRPEVAAGSGRWPAARGELARGRQRDLLPVANGMCVDDVGLVENLVRKPTNRPMSESVDSDRKDSGISLDRGNARLDAPQEILTESRFTTLIPVVGSNHVILRIWSVDYRLNHVVTEPAASPAPKCVQTPGGLDNGPCVPAVLAPSRRKRAEALPLVQCDLTGLRPVGDVHLWRVETEVRIRNSWVLYCSSGFKGLIQRGKPLQATSFLRVCVASKAAAWKQEGNTGESQRPASRDGCY